MGVFKALSGEGKKVTNLHDCKANSEALNTEMSTEEREDFDSRSLSTRD